MRSVPFLRSYMLVKICVDDIVDTTTISRPKELFLLTCRWRLNNMSKIETAWVYHGNFVLVLIVLFLGSILWVDICVKLNQWILIMTVMLTSMIY